jgi:hypothetical protein
VAGLYDREIKAVIRLVQGSSNHKSCKDKTIMPVPSYATDMMRIFINKSKLWLNNNTHHVPNLHSFYAGP